MIDKKIKICIIEGDGVGPELTSEALKVLKALPVSFEIEKADAGYGCFQKEGTSLPKETIDACRRADAVLFASVTTPPHIKDYKSPIVALRQELDLYACVRPIFSIPLKNMRQGVDMVIVRENTEGMYAGDEEDLGDRAITRRIITKRASERIIRFAFEYAKQHGKRLVTAVHKANIMRATDGLFLRTAEAVAKGYPDIRYEDMLVDSCAMRLIKDPQHFQVIVTTNMFGDILSDEASMLVGGLGVVASANIGEKHALFEPAHGSVPKYAGQNKVNPLATFFSVAMMLEYLGFLVESKKLKGSVVSAIEDKIVTYDLGGSNKTSEVTDQVIKYLRK